MLKLVLRNYAPPPGGVSMSEHSLQGSMGHNSFIKGSIARLTGVRSLSAGAAFHCSYIWWGRGRRPYLGRGGRRRAPPNGMIVMKVVRWLIQLPLSVLSPIGIFLWNNVCEVMASCNCANPRGKSQKSLPNYMQWPCIPQLERWIS